MSDRDRNLFRKKKHFSVNSFKRIYMVQLPTLSFQCDAFVVGVVPLLCFEVVVAGVDFHGGVVARIYVLVMTCEASRMDISHVQVPASRQKLVPANLTLVDPLKIHQS